ncbi:MAG: sugar phosphate isomerase/epimerase [Oscillospiraceae bacterium]|jgi:sugar phosphate isomerase/epimerase|nr:sugar phosphate isomerase/epimerase [Oscillospiraceae bacterium]
MKISASSYSFQQYLNAGKLTQLSCIRQAAELGFDAVEFVGIRNHNGYSETEYAKKLRREARDAGLEISCYTVGADFLSGSGGDVKAEINRVKRQVELGAALGVVRMRHDATAGDPPGQNARSFSEVLPLLAEACAEIAEYAAGFGICTMVENHGFFCQDSQRVVKLFKAVNRANFGLLCDMGNFLCVDESPVDACMAVAPYTKYVHAKDFYIRQADSAPVGEGWFRSRGGAYLRGAVLGRGDVPAQRCLEILRGAGYNGTIALEFEGDQDCIAALAEGLAFLRRLFGGTSE